MVPNGNVNRKIMFYCAIEMIPARIVIKDTYTMGM